MTLGANLDYYLYNYDAVGITGYGVGNVDAPSAINNSLQGFRQPAVRNLEIRMLSLELVWLQAIL